MKRSTINTQQPGLFNAKNGQKNGPGQVYRIPAPEVFRKNPVLLLRIFRLAGEVNRPIEKHTLNLIKRQKHLIDCCPALKVRAELFKILNLPQSRPIIEAMDQTGLLPVIFPEIVPMKRSAHRYYYHKNGLWQHALESLAAYEEFINQLKNKFPDTYLHLEQYLAEDIGDHINRKTFLKLVALLHDLAKPETAKRVKGRVRFFGHERIGSEKIMQALKRLKISAQGIKLAQKIVAAHMRPANLSNTGILTERAVYRFFRDYGKDGIDLLLVALADRYSYLRIAFNVPEIKRHKSFTSEMFRRYFQKKEKAVPQKLINGKELMRKFRLAEGPLIGKLLKIAEAAQAQGKVKTRENAYNYIASVLTKEKKQTKILKYQRA